MSLAFAAGISFGASAYVDEFISVAGGTALIVKYVWVEDADSDRGGYEKSVWLWTTDADDLPLLGR